MRFAFPLPVAWIRILVSLLFFAAFASAQVAPTGPPQPVVPESPIAPQPAEPPAVDSAPVEPERLIPNDPSAAPAAGPDAGAPATATTPETPEQPVLLRVVIRAEPPGPSAAGVVILSDDGKEATTADDGSAELELIAGARALRLTLPLSLTPAHPGPDPKLIRLEGIQLSAGQAAELRVAVGPDGAPGLLELVPLPPAPPPGLPVPEPEGANAGDASYGSITGQVITKDAATAIDGVSLFVEGFDAETTSDSTGRFSLRVPVGRHTVWVIHKDFPTLTLNNVDVKAGKDTEIRVELMPPSAEQDDWVIRAHYIAGGVASVLEERRKSSSVSDALGSEEISKSPDSSASSATRRIVGASIVGGQYLFARGLGGRYTNVRLNGVPLPSTDPDLPGFQLDLFPASLLSSLTITKTFSPDIPGDFAGGSLNVVTRAFPEKFKLTLSTSLQYNTETTGRQIPSYAGGDLDAFGTDDGTRALPDGVPAQRVSSSSGLSREQLIDIGRLFPNVWDVDTRTALPNLSFGLSIGDTLSGTAGRFGYLVTLGYRHRFDHYDETVTRVGLAGTAPAQTVVAVETLNREVGNRDAQLGALGTLSYEPTPDHRLSGVSFVTQTGEDRATVVRGYSESEGTNIETNQLRFIERRLLFNQLLGEHKDIADVLDLSWQLNASRTLRDQPATRDLVYAEGANGIEFRASSGSGDRLYSELRQGDFGGGLNLSLDVYEQAAVKAGYLGRSGSRDFGSRRFSIQYLGGAPDRRLEPELLFAPDRSGELWLINETTLREDGYTADEDLHAGYALFDGQLVEAVKLMGGLRIENFHQKIVVASPFALVGNEPLPGADRTDLDYLPAIALIVSPTADMNLRAGYGGTVARPLTRELAPVLNQDFVRRRYAQGNPNLKRTFIHNFDVRWELFPTPTEVFAVSGFYKVFEDPIETLVLDQNGNLSYGNIDGSTNYGAELEARIGLGLLTPALESFNALANLALIQSSVSLSPEQQRQATNAKRPLAGQSPYVANLALGYDSEATGFSAYVYYNVFGRRIQDVGQLGLPDVYEEPFHALDMTAFWKTKSQLTLGVSASNLLLQPVLQTQGGLDFSRAKRGANFGLSLSWSP